MASELYDALQILLPITYASIPESDDNLRTFLTDVFAKCRLLIDSIPYPETPATGNVALTCPPHGISVTLSTRARSASSVSDISASSARAPPIHHPNTAAGAGLAKAWGRPLKLASKNNPLGMGVHKLSGRDGRGAWFARRSVHEGLGFSRWKLGLEREFDESMRAGQGSMPGVGNVRGIGGERRVVRRVVEGVGLLEVYHLNAQFPGPTSPRDFVAMVLSSEEILVAKDGMMPRHFLVVSKPCQHEACPPREGFVRGEYESVEFIREIVVDRQSRETQRGSMSRSTGDLLAIGEEVSPPHLAQEATLRHARQRSVGLDTSHATASDTDFSANLHSPSITTVPVEGRVRGKTISFAESRGATAKGEALDMQRDEVGAAEDAGNPVEWVMITRSDPGGSVPRFLVERGTPSGIVADASKFLDWAVKKEHSPERGTDEEEQPAEERSDEENQGKKLEFAVRDQREQSALIHGQQNIYHSLEDSRESQVSTSGIISTLSNVIPIASSTLEVDAPKILIHNNPGHETSTLAGSHRTLSTHTTASCSSSTSLDSFASADSHLTGLTPRTTTATATTPNTDHAPIPNDPTAAAKRAKLDGKLTAAQAHIATAGSTPSAKDLDRLQRAEERHTRNLTRLADARARDRAKDEARRAKKAQRAEQRARKGRERSERDTARDAARMLRQRVDGLMGVMGDLQRENTALVAALGRLDGGAGVLAEMRARAGTGTRTTVGGNGG